jgi:hypothetical protein
MICDQCGTNNQANTGFCPNCGSGMKPGTPDDCNVTQDFKEVSAQEVSMAAGSVLIPVCKRRGVFRSSLPWVALFAGFATVGTAVQLSTRNVVSAATQTPTVEIAPPTAVTEPAAVAVAEPALSPEQNTISRLLKISDVTELVKQPEVAETLKQVLGADLAEFEQNLSVGGSPVIVDDTITFTTCAPQACGVSEAAVSVTTGAGTLTAAILANNHIRFYGAKSDKLEDCPTALQKWANKLAQGSSGKFTYEMRSGAPGTIAQAQSARD